MPENGLLAGKRKTKLLDNAHSGRLRPHHHTSYGSLLLVLVLAFVPVAFLQRAVFAGVGDTSGSGAYGVYGVVAHPLIGTAPQITNVPNGAVRTTNDSLQLSGTCPGTATVHIYKNNVLGASVACRGGSFSTSLDLFVGNNSLVARAYNADGVPGPDSAPLLVILTIPAIVGASANTGSHGSSQFYITSDTTYQAIDPGKALTWPLAIFGGQQPYSLRIDWGDGTVSHQTQDRPGNFTITHTYGKSATGGQYAVEVQAVDRSGNTALLQLNALEPAGAQTTTTTTTSVSSGRVQTTWAIIGLLCLTIMVAGFWIGEKRELHVLRQQKRFA